MKIRFQSKSIRTKLMFWFLMTALVPLLIIAAIDAYAPVKTAAWARVVFLLGAAAFACVIAIFLARGMSKQIVHMTEAAEKMQAGDLSVRIRAESQDEIGLLAESLNTMADAVTSQTRIQRGNGRILETIATADGLRGAVEDLGKQLVDLTGSDLGACYIFNEDNGRFDNLGAIELSSELLERFETDNREGRLGEILSTRDMSVVREVTHDTIFTFKTSTGTVLPREIITVPLIAESRVSAIIALGSLNAYSQESIEILDRSRAAMNAVTSNLIADDKMRRLTETLSVKNQRLQSQLEELQVQSKRLEAELQDKMEHLERAKCLQSELLPNMSHELRTLLTSMLVLSHVLVVQADERFSEKERSYLKIIERNGQRLLSLVNDTLDISKVQAGKMPVSVEVFSLRSTTAEIVERLIAMAEGKGIVIEHEIPDNMHIESDRRKVEQAMQNIIWNAVKFTEKGQVTISARADESNTYIDVTDTGIGMAQADLPYIFDDFRQVCGNSPAHFEGTGLGLAIAKTFTEMLGGTISVVSKVGEGSTFTLTLPTKWQGSVEALRRPALRQQAKRSKETVLTTADGLDAAEITATNIGGSPRPKILLVEDNPDDRTALQAVLGGRYVLVEAHDGEQALASISRERPDLVLLDMALPGMDGLAVAQRIRENEKTGEMPVIVLTARAMTYDREKTLAAGCDDYVSKPFDAERLLAKVAHFLGEAAVSSSNGTVEGLASEAGQSGRIRLDQELASSKPDEASEDDVEEHRAQPMECQTQSGAEEGMSLGVCPATTSTAQDGTARWGALVTELRRLIADVVRLCRRKDPSKGRDTRRVARIEKRLRKFIETD